MIGREYQHIEDQLISSGTDGAIQSLEEMLRIANGEEEVKIKWDGASAVYWGRDKRGYFYFAPQAQWKKSIVSKEDIRADLLDTGKKSNDSEEEHFVKRYTLTDTYDKIWNLLEKSTPKNINTFFKGDILFSEKLKKSSEGFVFTPNKVKYVADMHAFHGKIQTAELMIAIHGKVKNIGDTSLSDVSNDIIEKMNNDSDDVLFVGSVTTTETSKDQILIDAIKNTIEYIRENKELLEKFLTFEDPDITNEQFRKDLYSFSIERGRTQRNIPYKTWLNSTSKLSDVKKTVVLKYIKSHSKEVKTFEEAHQKISESKNILFYNLNRNTKTVLGITAIINNEKGGEGFITKTKNKLINPAFRSAKSKFANRA